MSGQTISGQALEGKKDPCIVSLSYGDIIGKKTSKAYQWFGVPYGKTKRWQAPMYPNAWSGKKSCKKYKTAKGDDCLYVNVFKPLQSTMTDNLPVMVFLHGGGNVGGSANRNFSTFVEETNVIVVSVEFRQGAFGWFQSRGLKTGNKLTDSGNFAMLDIRLALEWVQQNIPAFGGDKNNVTLTGFSAGARDALNCMISPVMSGLFHKIISFSGGMTTCTASEGRKWSNEKLAKILVSRGTYSTKKSALRHIKRMSKKKLNSLLMSLTDKQIKKMTGPSGLRLTNLPQCFTDGKVIPKDGFDCLEYGGYNRVPIIISSNHSEFANISYRTMQRILTRSPKTFKNKSQFYRLLKISKKYGSKLQSSFYLEMLANKIAIDPYHSDIFTYRFMWGEDSSVVGKDFAKYVGAIHGMDVDFLLGRYNKGQSGVNHKIYKESNLKGRLALSKLMRQYLKNFFYYNNPNGMDGNGKVLTGWNRWSRSKGAKRILTFNATNKTAKATMTSKYINRTKVKYRMRRMLSKKTYKFLKKRILNDRFFV